jgi:hypothetical protein
MNVYTPEHLVPALAAGALPTVAPTPGPCAQLTGHSMGAAQLTSPEGQGK